MSYKLTFKTKSEKVLRRMVDTMFAKINQEHRLYNFDKVRCSIDKATDYSCILKAKKNLVADLLAHQSEFYWHDKIVVDFDLFESTKVILVTAF